MSIYTFVFTGETESWGRGFYDPEKVDVYRGNIAVLKGDATLSDIQNSTVTLTEVTDADLLAKIRAKYSIPAPSE